MLWCNKRRCVKLTIDYAGWGRFKRLVMTRLPAYLEEPESIWFLSEELESGTSREPISLELRDYFMNYKRKE